MATKLALVTGGLSGLGLAMVRLLISHGYQVAVFDLDESKGEELAQELGIRFYPCNVANYESWHDQAEKMIAQQGVPEKVFLNAGIMSRPPSAAIDDNIFDWFDRGAYEKVMNVNVAGALYGIRLLIDRMVANGGGDITVTASTAAVTPLPFDPIYSMSKHALVGMVKSFAPLYEKHRIRLNAFCPSGMATAIVPDIIRATANQLMAPEDAALSLYEVSEKSQTGGLWLRLSPTTPLQEYVPPQVKV